MTHKTKAAITGRRCYYSEGSLAVQGFLTFGCPPSTVTFHRNHFITGGQSLSAPVIAGTSPLARLRETTQKLGCLGCTALAHTPFPQIWGELDQRSGCTAMQHTQSPKIPGDTLTEIMAVVSGATAVGHTTEKSRSFDRYPDIGFQFFGSMPRCFNSFLTIRLSHAERVASPSSCIAATIASSSAGSTRKAICLLPLGIFMFDMCLTLGVIFVVSSNVHHVSDTCKARGPAVLPALTGPLTTNRYTR
ncbi:TPA: hypothetical protein NED87_004434 [Escherichia coli]|nr:hypothetical protein [Escherichia coli]